MQNLLLISSLVLFLMATLASAGYGIHLAVLLYLFRRRQKDTRAAQGAIVDSFLAADQRDQWPCVTTQLPIYNEYDVVQRLLEAAVNLDYPRDRHEIQVLDDSTDATGALSAWAA